MGPLIPDTCELTHNVSANIIRTMANSAKQLQDYLGESSALHSHLCPRQVLGVRAGLAASTMLDFELPQRDKRVIAFVETDGCFVDGVSVTTGCTIGRRTLRLIDYGKVAVTFVDSVSGAAYRISPRGGIRELAKVVADSAETPWHAQVEAYQSISAEDLLCIEQVKLTLCLDAIISKPGLRVNCAECGEEVMNARQVTQRGRPVCLGCATQSPYYLRG